MSEFVSHYGDGGKFLRPALMNFKNTDLLEFFCDRGIRFTADENGKYFPETGTAKDVLSVLLKECKENQIIEIICLLYFYYLPFWELHLSLDPF